MSDELKTSAYDKLTPQRKLLVDAVLKNIENGVGLWEQGWAGGGAPVSAITGKQYNGVNRIFLLLASMERGYSDNRWLTYKQMEDKGWHFKTDEEGKSLGKGAGVAIEYFELRDKETKQPFDRHTLDGMTAEERADYMDENVYPLRKYYRVFNGDVIEGIPERKKGEHDASPYRVLERHGKPDPLRRECGVLLAENGRDPLAAKRGLCGYARILLYGIARDRTQHGS